MRRECRDVLLSLRIVAAQLQHGRVAVAHVERARGLLRQALMRRGDPVRRRAFLQQRLQSLIDRVDAGEVVQDALVDPQRRRGEPLAGVELDQAEAAQRAVRRERAPVRRGQRRGREAERHMAALAAARGLGAQRREPGVHLDAGAEQEDVALEWAQLEKAVSARRSPAASAFSTWRRCRRRRPRSPIGRRADP